MVSTSVLNRALRGSAIRSRSAFCPSSCFSRPKSTVTVVEPHSDGRTMALPIAFLGVKGWTKDEDVKAWKCWATAFSKAGYGSSLIELDAADKGSLKTSQELLSAMEADLAKELESTSYPPLLISSHLTTLIAQQYVSSHPLSGLILHSAVSPLRAHDYSPTIFKTALPDFNYEPQFPISIMEEDGEVLKDMGGRLLDHFSHEDGGDVKRVQGCRGTAGWAQAMHWMDANGL